MIFTSFAFLIFFIATFILYWAVRKKNIQNTLILIVSYLFYGWIHPWFCILIATSTLVDYFCGLEMQRKPQHKKSFLIISLISNLGMLGFFKYFNFFTENIHSLLVAVDLEVSPIALQIILPVGISFYTFQTLSYTIDIYKQQLEPRKNFIDFAVFVSFFPQLVAGPIERAKRFLPQVENNRQWKWEYLEQGFILLVQGYVKKLIIADNVAVYADKVFMLDNPPLLLLMAGGLAFTLQIYADFSAYTDIARGVAKLLGFDLVENFKNPYASISPSDFWRRWHISFSTWIRDYLYIPLGGSRVNTNLKFAAVLITSLGLSGLWHGAAWHFIFWGIFHGVLVFVYHKLGLGGRWQPKGIVNTILAWAIMFTCTVFGWLLFRTPNMHWLFSAFQNFNLGTEHDVLITATVIISFVAFYSVPLLLFSIVDYFPKLKWFQPVFYACCIACIVLFFQEGDQDFIYFQF